jgi:hypothetical protein
MIAEALQILIDTSAYPHLFFNEQQGSKSHLPGCTNAESIVKGGSPVL